MRIIPAIIEEEGIEDDAPLHERFINENKPNWKKVRVFDSLVDTISATASELGEA